MSELAERLLTGWTDSAASTFLGDLRRAGRDAFASQGIPGTKLEEWKYTSLAPLDGPDFRQAGPEHGEVTRTDVEAHSFPVFACSLFVFVDGRYEPALSTPGGLHVESLAALGESDRAGLEGRLGAGVDLKLHPFAALNTAFLDDGAVVTVPRGADLGQPVHLVFVSTNGAQPSVSHPRVLIVAEAGSRATVVQDHVSLAEEGENLVNAVTEVSVGENASLDLVMLQRQNPHSFLMTNLAASQARNSRFACHTITLGGRLVRNDASVLLGEEGASCELNGLFLGTGRQLVDNHTLVDHAVPHCTSRELYKGILGGNSRGVFRGRVVVRPGAQKTLASQSNPNLLLADGAEIDTKPQLEIHADDVKCSHGSAIGRVDPEALFYLQARGIDAAKARILLTRGFAAQVLRALPDPSLGEVAGELLAARLDQAGVSA